MTQPIPIRRVVDSPPRILGALRRRDTGSDPWAPDGYSNEPPF
ncbi:hypothetical protein GCM10009535_55210 [Streptomyces thermocarboxydovorans]|uniref:Uncharacterized protein n=1 Tax=Streptomyces thermocarboxydovorans TaxID=59298 RepID=A0ABN1HV07_9ACTN